MNKNGKREGEQRTASTNAINGKGICVCVCTMSFLSRYESVTQNFSQLTVCSLLFALKHKRTHIVALWLVVLVNGWLPRVFVSGLATRGGQNCWKTFGGRSELFLSSSAYHLFPINLPDREVWSACNQHEPLHKQIMASWISAKTLQILVHSYKAWFVRVLIKWKRTRFIDLLWNANFTRKKAYLVTAVKYNFSFLYLQFANRVIRFICPYIRMRSFMA